MLHREDRPAARSECVLPHIYTFICSHTREKCWFAQENTFSNFLILSFCIFSHRSLDLTGPLFLGGVPNLPENFPFTTREFIGCMKDLHIDNRPVDMAGFIANNGTLPGACDCLQCDDSDVLYL